MGGLACAVRSGTSTSPNALKDYYHDMTKGLAKKLDDLMGISEQQDEETESFFDTQDSGAVYRERRPEDVE